MGHADIDFSMAQAASTFRPPKKKRVRLRERFKASLRLGSGLPGLLAVSIKAVCLARDLAVALRTHKPGYVFREHKAAIRELEATGELVMPKK